MSIIFFTPNLTHATHRKDRIHIQHIEQVSNTRCDVHYSNGVVLEKDCERAIREYNQQLESKKREHKEILRERKREWEERHRNCRRTRREIAESTLGIITDNYEARELGEELAENSCR
ncbi:MAG: hypothetical protein ABEI13_03250 [Candidatus Paceibacteria bacterium]